MDKLVSIKASIDNLLSLSKSKGYITYDDIIDISDNLCLSIDEVDKVSNILVLKGIIINEKEPLDAGPNEDFNYEDRSKSDYEATFQELLSLDPSLKWLIDRIRYITPPQYKEINTLIYQAQDGNEYARNRIVLMYLRVVIRIALNTAKRLHISVADTISTGVIGLIYAIDKFDPSGSYLFSQYFPFWVQQTIDREAPALNPDTYFPVHIKEKLFSIYNIYDEHFCSDCKSGYICPELVFMIQNKLDVNSEEAERLIRYLWKNCSIEEILEQEGIIFSDQGRFESEMFDIIDHILLKKRIAETLQSLKTREEEVIVKRFGLFGNEESTLEEVGQNFGVTRERIRQIEAKAIRKLRHPSRSKRLIGYR